MSVPVSIARAGVGAALRGSPTTRGARVDGMDFHSPNLHFDPSR